MKGYMLSLRDEKGNHVWSWWISPKNKQIVLDTNHALFNYYERDDDYSKKKMDDLGSVELPTPESKQIKRGKLRNRK